MPIYLDYTRTSYLTREGEERGKNRAASFFIYLCINSPYVFMSIITKNYVILLSSLPTFSSDRAKCFFRGLTRFKCPTTRTLRSELIFYANIFPVVVKPAQPCRKKRKGKIDLFQIWDLRPRLRNCYFRELSWLCFGFFFVTFLTSYQSRPRKRYLLRLKLV